MFYFLLFAGLAIVWRSYVVWRQTGINPYRLRRGWSTHDFIGRALSIVFAALAIVTAVFTFWPAAYEVLEFRGLRHHFWMEVGGGVLLALAFVWTLVAQAQMRAAWRIGIDRDNPTDLVRSGLFRISRNP